MEMDMEDFSPEELSQSQEYQQDPSFNPNLSDSQSSPEFSSYSSNTSEEEDLDPISEHLKANKALVFISCLLQLFVTCNIPGCGSAIDPDNRKVTQHGAVVTVNFTCNANHSGQWSSSPTVGGGKSKVWVLNALLASYCLTCGLHISQILEYFSHMKIACFARSFFYTLQTQVLEKIIWLTWSSCQRTEILALKEQQKNGVLTKLTGDGKFDSRGFSASYCTYTLMDLTGSKVVGVWVAQKHMVSCSADMEPYAAKTMILNLAWEHELQMDSITTDRSTSMKTMLENLPEDLPPNYIPPKHCFDIWHWIKCVLKELWAAAKLKTCTGLNDWISSINNMMWHSFSSCQGDPQLLEEKLMSIPEHVSNKHKFPTNLQYKECPHPPLVGDRNKAWLPSDSLAVKKIRNSLFGSDGGRMKDVPFMTGFTHTGLIENWNSLHNKYANKNYFYSYPGMLVRGALAALDHNYNCGREQAETETGNKKFDLIQNRFGNKWFAKKILENKSGAWREDIAFLVLKCLDSGRRPKLELPVASEDFKIRKTAPRPNKEEAIRHQQTRMKMS